jgi:hypothetical protein
MSPGKKISGKNTGFWCRFLYILKLWEMSKGFQKIYISTTFMVGKME